MNIPKLQIYLELSEHTLKLCGISFRISWNTKEARSQHRFFKYFEVKKRCANWKKTGWTVLRDQVEEVE